MLHVASPFPPASPKSEDEVIVPARDGALRVLRAARDEGVKRVVLTSSFAAIGYGHTPQTAPFDETSWTELRADLSAYVKSKTLAERAAWDFVAKEGRALELSVVNPVGIFGPVLGPDYSTSIHIIRRLMEGAIPGCPRLYFGTVDVRDAADLHLRAMTNPAAKGERFIAVAGDCLSMFEVAKVLRRRMGAAAKRVPRAELPDWLVRILAFWSPALRGNGSATRKNPKCDKRKSQTSSWLDRPPKRGSRRRHSGELDPPRPSERPDWQKALSFKIRVIFGKSQILRSAANRSKKNNCFALRYKPDEDLPYDL